MLNYSALIGLSEDANGEEVETRCQDLTEFLSSPNIPEGLRDWAEGHAALIDEALAELLDPDRGARQAASAELVAALQQKQKAHPEQAVVISADKNVRYEAVLKVMDELQKNNIRRVGLMVKAASR